jgi:hypothetical protein
MVGVGGLLPPSRKSAMLFLQSSELGLTQPLTRRQVCPLPPPPRFWGDGHTRWLERGWESTNFDEGTYTVVPILYTGRPWTVIAGDMITFTILNGLNNHEDARILVVGDAGAALRPTRSYTPLQLSFIIVFI